MRTNLLNQNVFKWHFKYIFLAFFSMTRRVIKKYTYNLHTTVELLYFFIHCKQHSSLSWLYS